jgi:hypothetical protein
VKAVARIRKLSSIGICICGGILLTLTLAGGVPSPSSAGEQTCAAAVSEEPVVLCVKAYIRHDQDFDARILSVRPEYVVGNPLHGVWGEWSADNGQDTSWLLHDVERYQNEGIKVIGYITAGYEGWGSAGGLPQSYCSLETNKRLIKNMAEIDHVDGIFIDELTAEPWDSSKEYLKELTDLAHSYGLITWGNAGVDEFDEWFFTEGGFDFMHSSETWRGQDLSEVQREWGHRISVTGFDPSYTAKDAFELTVDAWEKGLAFCYINDEGYSSIAPWFEEYVAMLREYGRDTTPPTVSDVGASDLSDTSAVITWSTDEASDSRVEFWSDGSARSVVAAALVTDHELRLAGLTPGTTYYYRLRCMDKAGNIAVHDGDTFTTEEGPAPTGEEAPETPGEIVPQPSPETPAESDWRLPALVTAGLVGAALLASFVLGALRWARHRRTS